MQRMIGRIEAGAALAILLFSATCDSLAAQEFAGREKLRAHSDEFRKEVIKVTDSVTWLSASPTPVVPPDSRPAMCGSLMGRHRRPHGLLSFRPSQNILQAGWVNPTITK
jgi:hypothetical protein